MMMMMMMMMQVHHQLLMLLYIASATVTIHVDDVNDHTPHFVRALYRTTRYHYHLSLSITRSLSIRCDSTMSHHVWLPCLYRTTMSESLTKGASVTSVSATDNDLGVNARLTYTLDVTLISWAWHSDLDIVTLTSWPWCSDHVICSVSNLEIDYFDIWPHWPSMTLWPWSECPSDVHAGWERSWIFLY